MEGQPPQEGSALGRSRNRISEKIGNLRDSYSDWKKGRLLDKELKLLGISDPLKEDTTEKLQKAGLDQLRKIHELESFGDVGAIATEYLVALGEDIVTDLTDPSYQHTLQKDDPVLQLHFEPFGLSRKPEEPADAEASMFLGSIDLLRLMDQYKDAEPPELVEGITNPTLSRFAIRKLGFHPRRGYRETEDGKQQHPIPDEELLNLLKKPPAPTEESDDWITIFIKGKDFFSDETAKKVESLRNLLYIRLTGDRTTPITSEKLEGLERESRIKAIISCEKNAALESKK